ncbi:MAG: HD-GYP domain-containing protein [Armatimonadota bacterium]
MSGVHVQTPGRDSNLAAVIVAIDECISAVRLYGQRHPRAGAALQRARHTIAAHCSQAELTVASIDGRLACNGKPIRGRVRAADRLMKRCKDRGVEGFAFTPGFDEADLAGFIEVILSAPEDLAAAGGAAAALEARNVEHIRLLKADEEVTASMGVGDDAGRVDAHHVYGMALSAVQESMRDARMGRLTDVGSVRAAARQLIDAVLQEASALAALTTIQRYDMYTFAHSVNVSILSLCIGTRLRLQWTALEELGTAGLLHDIGKVTIPRDVLLKPGELTREEREVIRNHPVEGARMLQNVPGMGPVPPVVAFEHHMRINGEGYPSQRAGQTLAGASRIVAVADCYDAMTAVRPYRPAVPPDSALRQISRLAGSHYDPAIVRELIGALGIWPVGSCVRLTTNEIAVVRRHNARDPGRPVVLLVLTSDGQRYSSPIELDLSQDRSGPDRQPRAIVKSVGAVLKGIDVEEVLQGRTDPMQRLESELRAAEAC